MSKSDCFIVEINVPFLVLLYVYFHTGIRGIVNKDAPVQHYSTLIIHILWYNITGKGNTKSLYF